MQSIILNHKYLLSESVGYTNYYKTYSHYSLVVAKAMQVLDLSDRALRYWRMKFINYKYNINIIYCLFGVMYFPEQNRKRKSMCWMNGF